MTHHPRRFGWKLFAILYPFVWGAVAINLFMLGLAWQALEIPSLSPIAAMLIALPVSLPVNFLSARWVKSLIQQAEA